MGTVVDLVFRVAAAEAQYVAANPESRRLHEKRYGSLVGLHFTRGPVRNEADVPESGELRALLRLHMLERGYS
jgi:hypothetical protein